jgi:hypothetical protein
MKQKFFTKHKKLSATISAFIFSSSIFSATFISTPSANAWSSAQTSASVFGGTSIDVGRSITTDSSGNIYTVGTFRGTVDFNPGVGVANLTSAGEDVFVTKFDSNGDYIWAKNFAASAGQAVSGRSIVIDSSGFLYITGYFSSTADFDPSAGTANLTSAGRDDVFVTKLDSDGNYVWAKRFGGTDTDNGVSIAVHSSGSVYVAGYFYGTADFDPGTGTENLTASGHADIYVVKLDTNGDLNWVKQIGSSAPDFAESITVDSSGSIYTTGYFYGAADFDPGAGTTNLTPNGASDAFILKLESNGSFVWAKSFGGASEESSASIKVDGSGNIHTTGRFSGTVDFDPGAGTANLTSGGTGSDDVYIAKFDSLGNYIWAKNVGGSSGDYGHSLAVDSTSNVYATGYFGGTADFDPSAGTANLTSSGNDDIFIVKLNSTGNYIWAKRVGGSAQDRGNSISVDSTGNTYVTGIFNGTVDFDPGTGNTNLSSAGNSDVYVLKLSTSGDAEVSTAPAAPTLNSVNAGDKSLTVMFTAGANNGSAITDYEYSLNNGTYTSTGTTTSPFTITGLSGRTAYSVTIKARNSVGLSVASSSLSATTTDASLDASEAARIAAKKAQEQKELTELLSVIPSIAGLALNLGNLTNSLLTTKCVKGKTVKFVKKGAKCPRGFVRK